MGLLIEIEALYRSIFEAANDVALVVQGGNPRDRVLIRSELEDLLQLRSHVPELDRVVQ